MDIGSIAAAADSDSGLTGFKSLLGFGPSSKQWPNKYAYVTNLDGTYPAKAWQSNLGYGFRVVRVDSSGTILNKGQEEGWAAFVLQLPPQSIEQDEIFAVEVNATFRGVVVEHQGSTLKDIKISGTTGISPKRTSGGVASKDGKPVLGSGRSGYEEFNELRSYFRAYVEQKRVEQRDPSKGELRLVFDNFKDVESLFVEPQRFTMHRDSSSPMTYKYDIQLKGIGKANAPKELEKKFFGNLADNITTVIDTLQTAQQFIQAGTGLLKGIESGIGALILNPLNSIVGIVNSLATGINTVRNFGAGFAASLSLVEGSFNKSLKSLNAAISGRNPGDPRVYSVIGNTKASNATSTNPADNSAFNTRPLKLSDFGVTRASLRDLSANVAAVRDNLIQSAGINLSTYNGQIGAVQTTAVPLRDPTILELQTIHGLMLMQRALSMLQSDAEQFAETVSDKIGQVAGLSSGVITIPVPGSYRVVKVLGNDNIQLIASRELGSPDRYKDIVVLNNLVPPYIATTSSPGVLQPGDSIFIPLSNPALDTGNRRGDTYPVTATLTEAEKALGVDLQLGPGNDLKLDSTGGLNLVVGMKNFSQAMALATNVEKGSLQRHQGYGVNAAIGDKMTTSRIAYVRGEIIQSVLSDPRTLAVPFVDADLNQGGDTLNLTVVILPKNHDQVLPLPVFVNGG